VPGLAGYPPLTAPLTSPLAATPAAAATLTAAGVETPGVRVCVGKEWYRFPSSFFLPHRAAHIAFIESGFGGELPQPYLAVNGSRVVRRGVNDENRGERDRYVDISTCDLIVDLRLPTPRYPQDAGYEPYLDGDVSVPSAAAACAVPPPASAAATPTLRWRSLWSAPFLHAESTPTAARAFAIPRYSAAAAVYGTYHVLARVDCDAPCPAQH